MSTYMIDGRRMTTEDAAFGEALASAHARRHRPLCLCVAEGLEMYVARLGGSYIIKRMPCTGSRHAPDCPSYEPPPELSGLGHLMGTAIVEDPADGTTTLRLGFAMSKASARSVDAASSDGDGRVASDGLKLTMRGLLHYLWDQADLTRWQPGFLGKRPWATVRRHLLTAAEGKIARGQALRDKLYIPEAFTVEQRDKINARRVSRWMQAAPPAKGVRRLMLLIAEVKEIVPARYGFKAVVKHVPDQAFALDEPLYRRMSKRFERTLSLWGAADKLHMMIAATFGINYVGVPAIEELTLMPTDAHWIPIEDLFDLQLVDRLVREGRRFAKCLRYDLRNEGSLASAVLLDASPSPFVLHVVRSQPAAEEVAPEVEAGSSEATPGLASWAWHVDRCVMPPLPPVLTQRRAISEQSWQSEGAANL